MDGKLIRAQIASFRTESLACTVPDPFFLSVPSYSLSVMSNSRSLILFELRIFTR